MSVSVAFFILLVSRITGAFCQTYYPDYQTYTYYPATVSPSPPNVPAADVSRSSVGVPASSTRAAVGSAIGVTFVITLLLCGLVFFFILRFSKRGNNKVGGVLPVSNGFLRVNENLKGVIVDENGLDVLYLKKVKSSSISFKKQVQVQVQVQEEDNKVTEPAVSKEKGKSQPLQETPLLRGESSTSDSLIWSKNSAAGPVPPPPQKAGVSPAMSKSPDSDHSMERGKIEKDPVKFEGNMMEALFGSMAMNRKSPSSHIFIFDQAKSHENALLIKSLGVTRKEIIDALIQGQRLNTETIEKLTKIAPNEEETSRFIAFNGDPTRLTEAESFLYYLIRTVPSAFTRLKVMSFRTTFESKVSQIMESLLIIESACNELRNRGVFLKLVEAVLKSGNRLSSTTSGGFNITALRKLSDVKSSDGETTLLHFAVQEIIRAEGKRCLLNKNRSLTRTNSLSSNISDTSLQNDDPEREYMILGLPIVGGLSAEFSNVKKAAGLDQRALFQTISTLTSQMSQVKEMVTQCGREGGFVQKMKGFFETAEVEMNMIKEEEIRVNDALKETTEYYYAGTLRSNGTNPSLIFVIARDFLTMVDQACVEVTRIVQQRNPGADSTSLRVFKFPKLPANFMSDNSNSITSDTDNIQVS